MISGEIQIRLAILNGEHLPLNLIESERCVNQIHIHIVELQCLQGHFDVLLDPFGAITARWQFRYYEEILA